jgi:hypothetical protein
MPSNPLSRHPKTRRPRLIRGVLRHEDSKFPGLNHILHAHIPQPQIRHIHTNRHIHGLTRRYHDFIEALEPFIGAIDTAEDVADVELDHCSAVDGAVVGDGEGSGDCGGSGGVGEG